jgi:hypothetical protein
MHKSVQYMGVDKMWSQTLLCNKSHLMNFRRWNYNCAFYYYYVIMQKIYKINRATFYIRNNWSFISFIAKRDATGKHIFR